MSEPTIAIIGAGLAGIACARALRADGVRVRLFDKGARPGGRLASRRTADAAVLFDHGAQHLTARSEAFASLVDEAVDAGRMEVWRPRLLDLSAPGEKRAPPDESWFRGAPQMNDAAAFMAEGLDIRCGHRVAALRRDAAGLSVLMDNGAEETGFRGAVVAVPAEQAAPLLQHVSPALAAEAEAAKTAPCIACGLGAVEHDPFPDADCIRFGGEHILSWAARSRSHADAWMLHGSAQWSQEHEDVDPAVSAAALAAAFFRAAGLAPAGRILLAHRWRYALVRTTAPSPFGLDRDAAVGCCGDWRAGARAEAAFLSGHQLGKAMRLALS
jgi:hypothetical protein